MKLDFLHEQRLAIEERDGELPSVDEFLHQHGRAILVEQLPQPLQRCVFIANHVLRGDAERRVLGRELQDQGERQRWERRRHLPKHDESRRRYPSRDEDFLGERLVERDAECHRARARVGEAQQLEETGNVDLPSARLAITLAQIEDNVRLQRVERFDESTHALVHAEEADAMAQRLDGVARLGRAVDHTSHHGLTAELHWVVDHGDRSRRC